MLDEAGLAEALKGVLDEALERLGGALLDLIGRAERLDVVGRVPQEPDVEEGAGVRQKPLQQWCRQRSLTDAPVEPSDGRGDVGDGAERRLRVEVLNQVFVQARLEDGRPASDGVELGAPDGSVQSLMVGSRRKAPQAHLALLPLRCQNEGEAGLVELVGPIVRVSETIFRAELRAFWYTPAVGRHGRSSG